MRRPLLHLVLVALVLAIIAAPADARRKKPASTAPGRYTDWGGEIDEVEVVQTWKLSDYTTLSAEPLDTRSTPLPAKDDNTFGPVQTVLQDPLSPFLRGVERNLGGRLRIAVGPGRDEKTLLLRGKVTKLDPGSQAARYWVSFGAGAARVEIQGELVDAASGNVLLRFRQERRSGVGDLGGDYEELMNRSLDAIGEDVAFLLKGF
jgi:Domain of unknown function (DUF4410)